MEPKEFAERMKAIQQGRIGENAPALGQDFEEIHKQMDDLICEILCDLGYGEGVEIFENTTKYYA